MSGGRYNAKRHGSRPITVFQGTNAKCEPSDVGRMGRKASANHYCEAKTDNARNTNVQDGV
jgi:hypothetical protein